MAAALFRRGTGLCVRCIHRELFRLVWRPQTAQFSSKASDRKEPRRTHIKKAKNQPALDVAKLLEQLYSTRRPGTTSSAIKVQPAKASSSPLSSLSAAPVGTLNVPVVKDPIGAEVEAPDKEAQTKNTVSGVDDVSNTAKEIPSEGTVTAPPVEASYIPAETLETRAAVVKGPVDQQVQTNSTDSGPLNLLHNAAGEPLIETVIEEPSVETSSSTLETLEHRAAVEGPVETLIETVADAAHQGVQTNIEESGALNLSHIAAQVPFMETALEASEETSTHPLETAESRAAGVDLTLEPKVNATVDSPPQSVPANNADLGPDNLSHTSVEEPLLEMVEPCEEASVSPLETLKNISSVAVGSVEATIVSIEETADKVVQTNSTDLGVADASSTAKEEPLIETTTEPVVEARTYVEAAVSESTVEPTIVADVNLSHTAFIRNTPESESPHLKEEVESSSGNVPEERVNRSEQMTLESVTLHGVQVQVESLETEELLQVNVFLSGKVEEKLQELLVQTGIGAESRAAAESQNSAEDEGESLRQALSKWDSLSEDLQELEGESGMLVNELLCHVPAGISKTPDSASDPPAGSNRESSPTYEKDAEEEAMTLESITLANVKAEVRGLETEVLLQARNELEKEAEVLAKAEKMEVLTREEEDSVFESLTDAELLSLDSICEATDAIEAEAAVILEVMFGSEQGLRQPPENVQVDQKLGQKDEGIGQGEGKESGERDVRVLEAMTLESVTLAEMEASLGNLESEFLSETTNYLEKEAEVFALEKGVQVGDEVTSEEETTALNIESLSLLEDEVLSEALQVDALMEELLFSVPGPIKDATQSPIDQEAVREHELDATVATGSVNIDTATAVGDDFSASPAPRDVLQGEEVEVDEGAQNESLENVDDAGTHSDLDPVQRLFLEKIREYSNMHRLNGGPLEANPDYEKNLSEETAKLQRLFGGGDLSSFPEFTFTDPKMDQDS
ncbi:uncharacterized protein LOC132975641 [Labrus mixtus]|uniref:uncharacterized protein LOC132975641 n=1 Tax=Labrus mixtus TaxID=508554 RepID=UPI0029C01B6C|nr:uncharacterized protein LOC132975641 [Labrus mixtus]